MVKYSGGKLEPFRRIIWSILSLTFMLLIRMAYLRVMDPCLAVPAQKRFQFAWILILDIFVIVTIFVGKWIEAFRKIIFNIIFLLTSFSNESFKEQLRYILTCFFCFDFNSAYLYTQHFL